MLISLLFSLTLALPAVPASGQGVPSASERRTSSVPAKVPGVESVLRILPSPSGLTQTGEIALYPAAKLKDRIDRGVEVYQDYGVIETGTISFERPGAKLPQITIDLHRFAEPKNAFGIFRSQRGDGSDVLTVGAEGAWQPGLLTFWQGPYYARIVSGASQDSTLACARSLSSILPTAGDTLIQMGFFPRATINGTERWVPRSFLGIKGLDDVWTATCKDSAGTFEVFFRRNRPPLRDAEVGKVGKIATKATEDSPIQMINLAGAEKGKVLLLFYKKMARYAAGYVGPKPGSRRTTFISNWVDQLPLGR